MRVSSARLWALVFLIVGVLLGFFVTPQLMSRYQLPVIKDFPYRFGLDIQGGTHLVYKADLANISIPEYESSMSSVRDVIERRVNLFGIAEPLVQVEKSGGEWRLIVELAGVQDTAAAIRLIGETPFLEFREEGSREPFTENPEEEAVEFQPTNLTGRYVKRASLEFHPSTFEPIINLELTDEGGVLFAEITKRNIGKQLAIFLDGAPISAPVVREEIAGGKAQITGSFTPESAKELVGRLNAGALPVPISLIAQQTVGPSLGQESLERSVEAGVIGFLLVTLFMVLWYRLPGLLSVAALLLYVAIVLAIFKFLPITLTVAGIAGFILSIGMAVDANVLIFERMKEELRLGKALGEAIGEGFGRAWTSIRDSNVSSLITCAILYIMGSSIVQGFALTLAIGILVSMFSAISVTRTLLIGAISRRFESMKWIFMGGINVISKS